ncbi:MAG TPA: class I SAM-dependent methyltransferase [Polyangiaceae bacterium]|nr:class I SAM-dependent methyltransferase [Polyangiaceae bacterium]
MPDASTIASAYDGAAAEYDERLQPVGWIRRALWRHFGQLFHAGDHVLDVGCGTGSDTLHLASRGVRVTAVDVSPEMVQRLRAKLARASLEARVDVHIGDIAEIVRELTGPFDGIVSSFAALNTVDLPSFVPHAARALRPGGRLVAHLLSPGYGSRGARRWWSRAARPSAALANGTEINIHGRRLAHLVLPGDELYRRFFSFAFARRRAYALGLLVGSPTDERLPERVLDWVAQLEARVSSSEPLTSAGRFYVLDLETRRDAGR